MTEEFHLENQKLLTLKQAAHLREVSRNEGRTIVLTNGCFDLLHTGHLYFLQHAAQLGDELWIALNTTHSIQKLKGPSRPILSDQQRAFALAALECVDIVFLFDTPTLHNEILAIKPDIYVKAGDYTIETLNKDEYSALQKTGAKIHFMPFLKGFSTTNLIKKIKATP